MRPGLWNRFVTPDVHCETATRRDEEGDQEEVEIFRPGSKWRKLGHSTGRGSSGRVATPPNRAPQKDSIETREREREWDREDGKDRRIKDVQLINCLPIGGRDCDAVRSSYFCQEWRTRSS